MSSLISFVCADFPTPQIEFNPEQYVCYRTTEALELDGKLKEVDWEKAPVTRSFVDIEGDLQPKPYLNTEVKMLWDDTYFYFGIKMEEPHLWATLTERDAVIFYDNDFEIFIDPDGDTHNYYELEVNALGTEWDLLLLKPYRDQGRVAVDSWDISGLITAIHLDGTLNDPSDEDNGWSVEIAIPWKVLEECALKDIPGNGDQWRVNFSRVQWELNINENGYEKLNNLHHNWVWSPQGLVAMHYPEMWGFVQFSSLPVSQQTDFKWDATENIKWELREIYYAQKNYHEINNEWAGSFLSLKMGGWEDNGYSWPPRLEKTLSGYIAQIRMKNGKVVQINEQGRVTVK